MHNFDSFFDGDSANEQEFPETQVEECETCVQETHNREIDLKQSIEQGGNNSALLARRQNLKNQKIALLKRKQGMPHQQWKNQDDQVNASIQAANKLLKGTYSAPQPIVRSAPVIPAQQNTSEEDKTTTSTDENFQGVMGDRRAKGTEGNDDNFATEALEASNEQKQEFNDFLLKETDWTSAPVKNWMETKFLADVDSQIEDVLEDIALNPDDESLKIWLEILREAKNIEYTNDSVKVGGDKFKMVFERKIKGEESIISVTFDMLIPPDLEYSQFSNIQKNTTKEIILDEDSMLAIENKNDDIRMHVSMPLIDLGEEKHAETIKEFYKTFGEKKEIDTSQNSLTPAADKSDTTPVTTEKPDTTGDGEIKTPEEDTTAPLTRSITPIKGTDDVSDKKPDPDNTLEKANNKKDYQEYLDDQGRISPTEKNEKYIKKVIEQLTELGIPYSYYKSLFQQKSCIDTEFKEDIYKWQEQKIDSERTQKRTESLNQYNKTWEEFQNTNIDTLANSEKKPHWQSWYGASPSMKQESERTYEEFWKRSQASENFTRFSGEVGDIHKKTDVDKYLVIATLQKETSIPKKEDISKILKHNHFQPYTTALFAIDSYRGSNPDTRHASKQSAKVTDFVALVKNAHDRKVKPDKLINYGNTYPSNAIGALGYSQFMASNLHLVKDKNNEQGTLEDLYDEKGAFLSTANFIEKECGVTDIDYTKLEHINDILVEWFHFDALIGGVGFSSIGTNNGQYFDQFIKEKNSDLYEKWNIEYVSQLVKGLLAYNPTSNDPLKVLQRGYYAWRQNQEKNKS